MVLAPKHQPLSPRLSAASLPPKINMRKKTSRNLAHLERLPRRLTRTRYYLTSSERDRTQPLITQHSAHPRGDLNYDGAFSDSDIDPFFTGLGGGVCP